MTHTDMTWRPVAENDRAAVGRTSVFAELGRRRLRKLARNAELARFVPGEIVETAESPTEHFHVVVGGAVEIRDETGTRRIGAGGHFGGEALLGRATPTATVVATDELRLLRVPRAEFFELVRANPQLAVAVAGELARSLRRMRAPEAA